MMDDGCCVVLLIYCNAGRDDEGLMIDGWMNVSDCVFVCSTIALKIEKKRT